MTKKLNKSENQQENLEIANTCFLKETKDKCQYCEYIHKRKKDKCLVFGKTCRKCATPPKKTYFYMQSQKERY